MRKSTLVTVSIILHFIVLFCLDEWYWPKIWHRSATEIASIIIASFVIGSLIAFLLEPLNKRFLAWRKTRGRDIEDEERYESDLIDHGMISLRPRQEESSKK